MLEAVRRQTGIVDDRLISPLDAEQGKIVDATHQVLIVFSELSKARQWSSTGCTLLLWSEIESWQRLADIKLPYHIIRLIKQLDTIYVTTVLKDRK